MSEIERRLYKTTLNDIKRYVTLCSKGIWHGCKYVMLETDNLPNVEFYIDMQGPERPHCSALMFGKITPSRTYLVSHAICGEYEYYVSYEDFCELLYAYIKENYKDKSAS